MKKEKCQCARIMCLRSEQDLFIHLYGCPESEEVIEYEKLPWYKKMFHTNPLRFYHDHMKS